MLHTVRLIGGVLSVAVLAHSAFGQETAVTDFAPSPAEHQAEDWNLHGQMTVTEQMHPAFTSPYAGPQSLSGKFQAKETISATLYAGGRLWQGAEVYLNPEMGQGFGFSDGFGVAAFPNGEAATAGYLYPHVYMARYFIKQTIGLGGEEEWLDGGANQLAGAQDVDRLTVIAGGLSLPDYFDNNLYAHDPRTNFTNWGLWEGGAYDYGGNPRGYTQGVLIDFNTQDWAVRYAAVALPASLDAYAVSFHGDKMLGQNWEVEERHRLADHPGRLRLLFFYNRGPMGNYRDALALAGQGVAIDTALQETRRLGHAKEGAVANLEQEVTGDLGAFARVSWNDGRNEDWGNTDIDQSVAAGLSLKGRGWGREDDTVGFGVAASGLSAAHRDFLAAGGMTLQLGDGRLHHYGLEKVVEAYYAYQATESFALSADVQLIENPGYNRDRGPVPVLGCRAHIEF